MQRGKKSKMNNICFVLLLLVSLLPTLMAESGAADKSAATVHIVHMKPSDGQEKPEVHHIKTLAAVLGSEEAAKKALVYHYTHAANGFAANLTEKQALELAKIVVKTKLTLNNPSYLNVDVIGRRKMKT